MNGTSLIGAQCVHGGVDKERDIINCAKSTKFLFMATIGALASNINAKTLNHLSELE
jgi:hypothetical protein